MIFSSVNSEQLTLGASLRGRSLTMLTTFFPLLTTYLPNVDIGEVFPSLLVLVKVSKFQKQIFLSLFEPKKERNYFLNSSLASKMSLIKNEDNLSY